MIGVTLRVLFSLAVVLFLIGAVGRLVRKPLGGRAAGGLAVLTRQGLSRSASVAVIRVDDRALVIGITEANITLLAEADLAAFEPAVEVADRARHAAPDQVRSYRPPDGRLAGSVLSPATWAPVVHLLRDRVLRDRTSRPR